MCDFSDDIFSVFDEADPDPAPVVKVDRKLPMKDSVPRLEEK
jgi:hypothetical protein